MDDTVIKLHAAILLIVEAMIYSIKFVEALNNQK